MRTVRRGSVTPYRVLLVSHTYTAAANRSKLDALARRVTLTAVIPERWRDALFVVDAGRERPAGYGLHALPIRFDGHVLRYVFPLGRLRRVLEQVRPDLVHVEAEPASLVLAEVAFLKKRYGYRLACFTWESIRRRAGAPGVERYNLRRCDGAIAGSAEAAEVIRGKGLRGPLRVTPQLPVDPETYRPGRSPELRRALGTTGFVVGYVGRLVEAKGLRTLIEAAAALPDVQLLVVGDGPLRRELETTGCARLVGAVPRAEVPRHLNALDALVLPSLTTATWKEQFGHVLIEAMACGVPVIGSSSGAIPDVIGDAGLIFREGDATALRTAIVALRNDPDRRALLARAGRARVLAHYTPERTAAATADFFDEVLRS
jgi:glycosyltransferase involved in cell wall biosynthesis